MTASSVTSGISHTAAARAAVLISRPLPAIDHPDYHDPSLSAALLGPLPDSEGYESRRRECYAPRETAPELVPLYLYPLLTAEQERHLFLKMNCLKVAYTGALADLRRGHYARLPEAESLRSQALAAQEMLVCSNLRLVLSVAKRFSRLVSVLEVYVEGHPVLIRTVTKFNVHLGYKFSTYVTWSLKKHYWSLYAPQVGAASYTGYSESALDGLASGREPCYEESHDAFPSDALRPILSYLEPRERAILRMRFPGAGEDPSTLRGAGEILGLTKERVRQVENRAIARAGAIARNLGLSF